MVRTTIDGVGRPVVPKAACDAMGLTSGRVVDVVFTNCRIEIEMPSAEVVADTLRGLPRLLADEGVPPLSDEDVRDVVESTRP